MDGHAIKAQQLDWESFEGGAEAYPTIDGEDYEITITGRERAHTAYYSVSCPNNRSWRVGIYGGKEIASGDADGLRASKHEALAALNAYLGDHEAQKS